jgi:hypothetical protein
VVSILIKKLMKFKTFLRQVPFAFPAGVVNNAEGWISRKNKVKSWYSLRDGQWYRKAYDSEIQVNKLPENFQITDLDKFARNRIRRTYPAGLYFLRSSFVYGKDGIVLSKDNKVFNEFTHNFNISSIREYIYSRPFHTFSWRIKKEMRYTALLCSPACTNYYHWLFDVMPRIALLGNILETVELFVVPDGIKSNNVDLLKMCGVDEMKLYKIGISEKIWFDNLYVPSLPGSEGLVPQWAIDFLRRQLIPSKPVQRKKKVYFTRKDTPGRKIQNEDELINYLKSLGFISYTLSEYPVHEQIEIAHSAEMIISSHSAGLANIVFADHCKIVEIFSPDYFRSDCYYTLAQQLGFQYWYLVGERAKIWGDITVNMAAFEQLLLSIEKKYQS